MAGGRRILIPHLRTRRRWWLGSAVYFIRLTPWLAAPLGMPAGAVGEMWPRPWARPAKSSE